MRLPRFPALRRTEAGWLVSLAALSTLCAPARSAEVSGASRHSIAELSPVAKIHLGQTADWVALTDGAIWVGTTGPDGVAQIDPHTNTVAATVALPGDPCAGLAVGFGGLWVPLCAKPNALARVDLRTRAVTLVPGVGPAEQEGGITVSRDSVWLVVDGRATLARLDPKTLRIRQTVQLPPGSLNPLFSEGMIWITRSTGAQLTAIEAGSGMPAATIPTGPQPRFLTAGAGAVWTLNQGDGTLTRIDVHSKTAAGTTDLQTPGHGGDITFAHGVVWTTMNKVPLSATDAKSGRVLCRWVGPGGDSLGVSREAIWLTDYHAGDLYRFDVADTLRHCGAAARGD